MQDRTEDHIAAARSSYERTYWRRSDEPSAWWPWGLLPLLGLVLLFLFGAFRIAPAIQAQTESRVTADLQASGIEVDSVRADGQIVNIHAVADEFGAHGIHAVAGTAECTTWAGTLRCPTEINLTLESTPIVVAEARHHDFAFSLEDGTLHLRGEAPSQIAKDALLTLANSHFTKTMDHLVVSTDTATSGFTPAGVKALRVLNLFDRGDAQWNAGVFNATGWITDENATIARQVFATEQEGVKLGNLIVNSLQSVSTCNEQFAALLGSASIRFRTSSAVIDSSSQALLEDLAKTAAECPGRLLIEGHTDSVGAAAPNQRLSLARAEAVNTSLTVLGVPASRLTAIGHGESEPVATNETAAGRAQNRRIVIRIME